MYILRNPPFRNWAFEKSKLSSLGMSRKIWGGLEIPFELCHFNRKTVTFFDTYRHIPDWIRSLRTLMTSPLDNQKNPRPWTASLSQWHHLIRTIIQHDHRNRCCCCCCCSFRPLVRAHSFTRTPQWKSGAYVHFVYWARVFVHVEEGVVLVLTSDCFGTYFTHAQT